VFENNKIESLTKSNGGGIDKYLKEKYNRLF
jgi:hypothetical protein